MSTLFRIARKEFSAFFSSPVAFIFLGTFLASPGYTDEVDHLFYTRTTGQTEHGKLDADERVMVEVWEHDALGDAVLHNKLKDGKTIVAWCLAREKGLV